MKTISFTFLVLLFSLELASQNEIINETKSLPRADNLIIGVFHDLWSGLPATMETKAFNRGFMAGLMYDKALGNLPLAVAAGAMISSHNLYNNSMPVNEINNGMFTGRTLFQPLDSISSASELVYSKNKINVNYLEIPVELRLRFSTGDDYFKISFGAKVGLLINAHTKYKGDDLSGMPGEVKQKNHMIRNLDMLRYSAYGRVGYKNYGVFYSMQLSSLFKKGSGPEMMPASIGLTISL